MVFHLKVLGSRFGPLPQAISFFKWSNQGETHILAWSGGLKPASI
jgi:hypothetical protein